MLAVLLTRVTEAALSHETALDAYGISDVNPNRIHVTVGKQRRLRRADGDEYVVHYEDLDAKQIDWWQEIPTVTAKTAIAQCLAVGTPTYLLGWSRSEVGLTVESRVDLLQKESTMNDTTGQIKEKFGGLRYYANVGDVDNETRKRFHDLIHEAEAKSYEICERCGQPGGLHRRGAHG